MRVRVAGPARVRTTFGLRVALGRNAGFAVLGLAGGVLLIARPGVFVAGEMLDWEAPTGGYLLQASFASAVVAAEGVIDWLDSRD